MLSDGSLKLVNEVVGSPSNVVPNWAVAGFVGTFHTHPRTDGFLPMPFSHADFVSAIKLREKLSLLYSDELVFALACTTTTTNDVNLYEIQNEFLAVVMDPALRAGFLPTAVWTANKWLAEKYGFGLYMGTPNEIFREV
jgi:hypothetical protein